MTLTSRANEAAAEAVAEGVGAAQRVAGLVDHAEVRGRAVARRRPCPRARPLHEPPGLGGGGRRALADAGPPLGRVGLGGEAWSRASRSFRRPSCYFGVEKHSWDIAKGRLNDSTAPTAGETRGGGGGAVGGAVGGGELHGLEPVVEGLRGVVA